MKIYAGSKPCALRSSRRSRSTRESSAASSVAQPRSISDAGGVTSPHLSSANFRHSQDKNLAADAPSSPPPLSPLPSSPSFPTYSRLPSLGAVGGFEGSALSLLGPQSAAGACISFLFICCCLKLFRFFSMAPFQSSSLSLVCPTPLCVRLISSSSLYR